MDKRLRRWPWLTVQIIVANVAIILALAAVWYLVFVHQSDVYSARLMSTFNIEPGQLHAMYVDDVERQLWQSVLIGIVTATLASIGLAWLIVRPLRSLARATERLRHGDYSIRSSIDRGEVGYLAGNINALAMALEREEIRRAQYLADLSHELRTPITNLRGYTEGLEDGVVRADAAFFKLMSEELSHLTALSHTIEAMQLDAEHGEADGATEPLGGFLTDAIARWRSRFDQRGLSISLEVPTGVVGCRVAVPVAGLRQMVDNLLSNMLRYASAAEPCVIDVAPAKRADNLSVTFSNHAPDVDESALPFLFDRFYRVSATRTRVHNEVTSGLGLAIVKQLCLAHSGHVSASLTGERLTLTVELPMAERAPA
ncbi:MAG: ATP-binding protein [Pseudomonadota bacterium]